MIDESNRPATAVEAKRAFAPWNWIPMLLAVGSCVLLVLTAVFPRASVLGWAGLVGVGGVMIYFIVQCGARLVKRRWSGAVFAFMRLGVVVIATIVTLTAVMFFSMFGPSEDHFADDLTIPEGIAISEPEEDAAGRWNRTEALGTDAMQAAVRAALATPGGSDPAFSPALPSLRRASTDHAAAFIEYIEASPDWHVFMEGKNRFASRRWSYGGEPRDELHGYISSFGDDLRFQTRCLLCLDRVPWSRYRIQRVPEDTSPVKPRMGRGNDLHESRVMIDCGGVWLEIFEQSAAPERRVTKATVAVLEEEFAEFNRDPQAAVAGARESSRALARGLAGEDDMPFRLLVGMQPGIYAIAYSLNPGEPGSVYLKAFEVTRGTPLSARRLREKSLTRVAWSDDPRERFGAKAGFTIYEGDWGKPYAARFEVWLKPDSGKAERKLAERIYKIEGWQR